MAVVFKKDRLKGALLTEGVPKSLDLYFDPEVCERKFWESGDVNADIHTREGLGIVQGMYILDRLGAGISQHMTGYVFCGFCEPLYQKASIYLGDTVTVIFTRDDQKDRLTRVKIQVLRQDVLVLENLVLLMDKETFKRRAKK